MLARLYVFPSLVQNRTKTNNDTEQLSMMDVAKKNSEVPNNEDNMIFLLQNECEKDNTVKKSHENKAYFK